MGKPVRVFRRWMLAGHMVGRCHQSLVLGLTLTLAAHCLDVKIDPVGIHGRAFSFRFRQGSSLLVASG